MDVERLVERDGYYHIRIAPWISIKQIDSLIAQLIEIKKEISEKG